MATNVNEVGPLEVEFDSAIPAISGPWTVDDTDDFEVVIIAPWGDNVKPETAEAYGDYRGAMIATIDWNGGVPSHRQAKANAVLISAAPDLLEALKAARELLKDYVGDMGCCDHAVGFCMCSDIRTLEQCDAAIAKATNVNA